MHALRRIIIFQVLEVNNCQQRLLYPAVFSAALINHHNQANIQKKRIIWFLLPDGWVRHVRKAWQQAAGLSLNWMMKVYMFNKKQREKDKPWEWLQGFKTSKPAPGDILLPARPHFLGPTKHHHQLGKQIFKYMSPLKTFSFRLPHQQSYFWKLTENQGSSWPPSQHCRIHFFKILSIGKKGRQSSSEKKLWGKSQFQPQEHRKE